MTFFSSDEVAARKPSKPANSGPLPAGEYHVEVIEAGTSECGRAFELVLHVHEDGHEGRKVWQRYYTHKAGCRSISLEQLSNLLECAGRDPSQGFGPEELIGCHVKAVTKVRKYEKQDGSEGASAEVRYYKPLDDEQSVAQQPVSDTDVDDLF
jgi:hypothetical protein